MNSADVKFYTPLEQWQREGVERFGPAVLTWRWKCPSCGQEQGWAEFLAIGMEARMVSTIVGFSCIGTWSRLHGKDAVGFAEPSRGFGCVYKGGREPNISPVLLVLGDEEVRPTFGWAK